MLYSVAFMMSMLFAMAAVCYSLMAVDILYQKNKTFMNWLFAVMCVTTGIWSVAFAITSGVDNAEAAVMWHRVASFGYGTVYSHLLVFCMAITGHRQILKKKSVLALIYLPAMLNVVFFTIPGLYEFQVEWSSVGWVAKSSETILDLYFYVCILVMTMISFGLLLHWRLKKPTKKVKQQFRLLFLPLTLSFAIGMLTDMVLSDYFGITLPQIAPLLILLPLFTAFYASAEYNLMGNGPSESYAEIFQADVKELIYRYMAFVIIIGGGLAFLSEYFLMGNPLLISVFFSGLIIIFGFLIGVVQRGVKEAVFRDNMVLVILCLIIPLIMFMDINNGSISTWSIPFLFFMVLMLYNSSKMVVAAAATSVLTLFVVMHIQPEAQVTVSGVYYMIRLFILVTGFFLAFLINRMYRRRLDENVHQFEHQKMVMKISSAIAGADQSNFDERLTSILGMIGKHFNMDRCYFFTMDESGSTMSYTHEWCNDGVKPEVGTLNEVPVDTFPWWMDQIMDKHVVSIMDVEALPAYASVEKEELTKQGIRSTMAVSVLNSDRLLGYIGLDSVDRLVDWHSETVTFLQIVGNLVSEAFTRNRIEKRIHDLAYYDQLTGLPSRQLFADRLNQAIHLSERNANRTMVAMMDLDGFKAINDTMGHDRGDDLLIMVADRLEKALRATDTVCRYGGDEFLILCGGIKGMESVRSLVKQITEIFEEAFAIGNESIRVTASVGVAVYPIDGETPGELIKNADIAMYHAKSLGKNTFAISNDRMKAKNGQVEMLSQALHDAIDNSDLFMVYQPQVSLTTGRVTGLEALIRWHHNLLGMISPVEFIKIAERNGFLPELGEWIFRAVFKDMNQWKRQGFTDFNVAINISPIQINHPLFVDRFGQLLEDYTVSAERVEIELTEGEAMAEIPRIGEKLQQLRDMGVTIAIDDFGEDFSSLGKLKDLSIDKLKIARPFITGIHEHQKDEAIIKSIIALAKNLNVATIAEGVENQDQAFFLDEQACDFIQGYYYYKPMSAKGISDLMAEDE